MVRTIRHTLDRHRANFLWMMTNDDSVGGCIRDHACARDDRADKRQET
jgi:hypothetical protein